MHKIRMLHRNMLKSECLEMKDLMLQMWSYLVVNSDLRVGVSLI